MPGIYALAVLCLLVETLKCKRPAGQSFLGLQKPAGHLHSISAVQ